MSSYTVREIAEYLSASVSGDAGLTITGIASLANAKNDQISFVASNAYLQDAQQSRAGALITKSEHAEQCSATAVLVDDPYWAYARLTALFDDGGPDSAGVHPSAVVADDITMGDGCSIGPNAVVESGVSLGEGVVIGPGAMVGRGCQIGARTRLAANVTFYQGVVAGRDCLFHSGCVIGGDGFGYAPDKTRGGWCKIYQLGGVSIGSRVEIGANTCIDRGALEDTRIDDGVIIDNLVHVAHNCIIGENTAIAAGCGMAGSTRIGRNCTMAGMAGVVGHIEITDNVNITGMAMVTKSITEPGSYSSGTTAVPTRDWRKNAVRFNQLNELARRVKALEGELEKTKPEK